MRSHLWRSHRRTRRLRAARAAVAGPLAGSARGHRTAWVAAQVLALQLRHAVVVGPQCVVRAVQQRVVARPVDGLQLFHQLLVVQPAGVDSGHGGTPLVVFIHAVRVPAR
ncbi:hypothetical protein J7E95_38470 [Streptomyces sp. ISL-14]|nr:hypothetical protein [Streptomyces sp. ISL-14]